MAEISQERMDELKKAALERINGVVVTTQSRFRGRLRNNVTNRSEKKTLNEALEELTWQESNENTCDYQIILPVLFRDKSFFKRLKDAIDGLKPTVADMFPYYFMDESLKDGHPQIVKAIEAFLKHDDIKKLFDVCFEPFKQESEERKSSQEALDVADKRRTRSILETFLTKTRMKDHGWIPYISYNLNEFWLDTEWGIRVIAKEYWYSSEQIETIIQNCNEFKKEVEVKTYRRNHSKEWRTFDKLLKGETWRRTDEVMSDPDRKEKAKSCGCSEQDITTIETNYQKSK